MKLNAENRSYFERSEVFSADMGPVPKDTLGDWLLERIKNIPLNKERDSYLSFGGQFRPRMETTRHANWSRSSEANENYYSQRIQFYADVHLKKHLRFYGQLQHGLISRKEPVYTQSDKLDLNQAFVDLTFNVKPTTLLTIRTGRQEVFLGTGRLMATREGLNIRRSFDMERIMYEEKKFSSQAWYGREVRVPTGIFDNSSAHGAYTWGVYNVLKSSELVGGSTDFYYFGYKADNKYNAGGGHETRNTIGFRRSGVIANRFRYNSEVNYQFGSFADKRIRAFSIEGDWHYIKKLQETAMDYGIKLDYISGDSKVDDNHLGTFNPMFNNPAYFGLINQIAAMNMFDVHPSVEFVFRDKFKTILEADFYWRAQLDDGLYSSSRALLRRGDQTNARYIGWQPGVKLEYRFASNLLLSSETYFFAAGQFIKQTGESASTFYNALTLKIDL
ncbi:alginate export family protein [Sphingobacterium sp. Lzh-3]|uniref:alginate export family protein n=1 Tax=Sphingobacterium sp. Lzh-3 TaxID=3382150 RepID=UPI00398D46E7